MLFVGRVQQRGAADRLPRSTALGPFRALLALFVFLGTVFAPLEMAGATSADEVPTITFVNGWHPADAGDTELIDVSVDGVCELVGGAYSDVSAHLPLSVGDHDFAIHASDGQCAQPPFLTLADVPFVSGEINTAILHADPLGEVTLSLYRFDESPLPDEYATRVSFVNLTDVDLDATLTRFGRTDPALVVEHLEHGFFVESDTWIGDHEVAVAFAGDPVPLITADVRLSIDDSLSIFAIGSVQRGTLDLVSDQRRTMARPDDATPGPLDGVYVTVSNVFLPASPGAPPALVGNAVAARVGDDLEGDPAVTGFRYAVELTSNTIELRWEAGSAPEMISEGTDTYYLVFAEDALQGVSVRVDPSSTLEATVEVVFSRAIVITVPTGTPIGDGRNLRLMVH